ncbi:MAG: CCA tRNA nucleotidyltransferase [Deltaproteobacteria bacterium]|nr:CCA tRNA nucleotidyltransferase [Deltaproteobacteria bacterium]
MNWGNAPAAWLADGVAGEVVLRDDLARALAHGLGDHPLASIARTDVPEEDPAGAEPAGPRRGATALGWTLVPPEGDQRWIFRVPVDVAPNRALAERAMARLLPPAAFDVLREMGGFAAGRGAAVLAVGGLVRDLAVGLPFQEMDLDLLVEGDAIALARAWGRTRGYAVRAHPAFGTAKCSAAGAIEVDLASMRYERYAAPGALPTVAPGTLVDDLHRRDFTANALALRLSPEHFGAVVDPFDGWGDLERRILRPHHPLSFVDDPTRLLRSARYRARLGLVADAGHERARELALAARAIDRVSGSRLFADLTRILVELDPVAPLALLAGEGVVRAVHPALHGWLTGVDRLRRVREVQATWPEPLAAVDAAIPSLAALAWEADADSILQVRRRLAPPGRAGGRLELEVPRARAIAEKLADHEAVRPSVAYKLLHDLPGALLVTIAALGGAGAASAVRRFVETSRHVAISTSGDDLRALGFEPGPVFGRIQARLRTARLDGEVHDRESELALVRREFLAVD